MTTPMLTDPDSVTTDELIHHIANATPAQCKAMLRKLDCTWMDFSDAYLNRLSLDQLRHITAAACLQVYSSK